MKDHRGARRILAPAFVLAAALALSPGNAQSRQGTTGSSQVEPAGNAENGKKLYKSDGCYQCHGLSAQGSSRTGPRLAPDPIAFQLFSYVVRHPSDDMPPYTSKVVSDQDLADIYAFLKSLPEPPSLESIPILQ
jgi:mono/diheme cytochrome c family protein